MALQLNYRQMRMVLQAIPSFPSDAEAGFIAAVEAQLPATPLAPTDQQVRQAIVASLQTIAPASTLFGNASP
jgi:hypothetical protein